MGKLSRRLYIFVLMRGYSQPGNKGCLRCGKLVSVVVQELVGQQCAIVEVKKSIRVTVRSDISMFAGGAFLKLNQCLDAPFKAIDCTFAREYGQEWIVGCPGICAKASQCFVNLYQRRRLINVQKGKRFTYRIGCYSCPDWGRTKEGRNRFVGRDWPLDKEILFERVKIHPDSHRCLVPWYRILPKPASSSYASMSRLICC